MINCCSICGCRNCYVIVLPVVTEGSVEESTESRSELSDQISQDWYSIPGDSKVHSNESSTESTPVTPSMDDLLCECFYMAIKTSINKDDLPVLTSTFYRSYIMPLW